MAMEESFPKCFESHRQFRKWADAARRVSPGPSSYCTDCTEDYQQRMVAQARCDHPGTRFGVSSEGGVDGRRPHAERVGYREVA